MTSGVELVDVNPVVVSVIVVPPACALAETEPVPATVKLSVSGPVDVMSSLNVRMIVLSAVLSAVNVGAIPSAAITVAPTSATAPEAELSTISPAV